MSDDRHPLVSIVVPAYNAERFLAVSLRSILAQRYEPMEVIVSDDASTDRTDSIVSGFTDSRLRYLRQTVNAGGYAAMNAGARVARGDYIAFYHADDVYDAGIVERESAFLAAHRQVGAVFCLDRFLNENGQEYGRLALPKALLGTTSFDLASLTENVLRHKNVFLRTPSVMLRREAFDEMEGFDQAAAGIAADLDMWLRLASHWHLGLIPEHLFGYRHFEQQWSRVYERLRTSPELYFTVVDRHLSRSGARSLVSQEALRHYEVWRVKDEAERAANLLVMGDPVRAVALLNTSLVRSRLRGSTFTRVLRVLALRMLVRAASKAGARTSRALVYLARFRRLPPRDLSPPPESASQTLALSTVSRVSPTLVHRDSKLRVFLDPFTTHFYGNGIFDPQSKYNRDDALRPWFRLRERVNELGIHLDTVDYLLSGNARADKNVYVSFGVRDSYRELARRDDVLMNAFYLFEVVVVEPAMYSAIPDLARAFRRVYSWTDPESLQPYVAGERPVHPFRIPMPFDHVIDRYWSRTEREGLVIVSSNKRPALAHGELYTDRLRAIKHFVDDGGIELWGRLWETGLGDLDAEFGDAVRRAWRGPVEDKYEAISRKQFAICFENMVLPGWITEKIFDCFYAGTIPVYLGAPDVASYIPDSCFVDARQFASYADLGRFLRQLSPTECRTYREAARDFFDSEGFRPFTAETFADRFIADIEAHLRERGLEHLWPR